jgi:molybdate transport system substrate-binding protein
MFPGVTSTSRHIINVTIAMRLRYGRWALCAVLLLGACNSRRTPEPAATSKLTVAAAANLTDVFAQVGRAFQAKTGTEVIFSFGNTAQLAQQIDNGAPFDLFASADTEHVDSLVSRQRLTPDSRAVYAVGQLALWIPKGDQSGIRELKDLADKQVHFIAVAQPELAPYGRATVETLKNAHLWEAVQSKVVYSNSISQAKQMAASGNADAAFTAYSLLLHDKGTILNIDPHLYRPIEQAMAIVASSPRMEEARKFRSFLLGPEGRSILAENGYLVPEIVTLRGRLTVEPFCSSYAYDLLGLCDIWLSRLTTTEHWLAMVS